MKLIVPLSVSEADLREYLAGLEGYAAPHHADKRAFK